jgi:hypothetical protein
VPSRSWVSTPAVVSPKTFRHEMDALHGSLEARHDPEELRMGEARHRDDDVTHTQRPHALPHVGDRPQHGNAVDVAALLARVIVEEPDRSVAEEVVAPHALQHLSSGRTRAQDQRLPLPPAELQQEDLGARTRERNRRQAHDPDRPEQQAGHLRGHLGRVDEEDGEQRGQAGAARGVPHLVPEEQPARVQALLRQGEDPWQQEVEIDEVGAQRVERAERRVERRKHEAADDPGRGQAEQHGEPIGREQRHARAGAGQQPV